MNNSIIELLTRQEGDTQIIPHATLSVKDYDKVASSILSQRRVRYCPSSERMPAYAPLGPKPAFSITPSYHFSTLRRPCLGYLQRMCLPFAKFANKATLLISNLTFQTILNSTEGNRFLPPLTIFHNYTVAEDFENSTKLGVAPDTNYRLHYNSYRLFVNTDLRFFFWFVCIAYATLTLRPYFETLLSE